MRLENSRPDFVGDSEATNITSSLLPPFSTISRDSEVTSLTISPMTTPPQSRGRVARVGGGDSGGNTVNQVSDNWPEDGAWVLRSSKLQSCCSESESRNNTQQPFARAARLQLQPPPNIRAVHSGKVDSPQLRSIPILCGTLPPPLITQRKRQHPPPQRTPVDVVVTTAAISVAKRTPPTSSTESSMPESMLGRGDLCRPHTSPVTATSRATIRKTHHSVSPSQRANALVGDADSDVIDQMESAMDYVETISRALASRTHCPPPPCDSDAIRVTVVPCVTAPPQRSSLTDLHDATNAFLGWFSRLECTTLTAVGDVSLRDMKCHAVQSSRDVMAIVQSLDARFSTHQDSTVRSAYGRRSNTVSDCRELMECLTLTVQHLVVLRRLLAQRDSLRVRDIMANHRSIVRQRIEESISPRAAQYQEAIMCGPFFEWLNQRWLPTMDAWHRLLQDAQQHAAEGDIDEAIIRSLQAARAIPNLTEVLCADETITDLHQTDVVKSILQMAQKIENKRDVIRALRVTTEQHPDVGTLGKALRLARENARFKGGSSPIAQDDESLIRRADQLMKDLQHADGVRQSLNAVLRDDEHSNTRTLQSFHCVHLVNVLVTQLRLVENVPLAERVTRECEEVDRKVQATLQRRRDDVSFLDLFPSSLSIDELYLSHHPSPVWSAGDLTLYQRTYDRLKETLSKNATRKDHELPNCSAFDAPQLNNGETGTTVLLDTAKELGGQLANVVGEAGATLSQTHVVRLKVHFEAQTRMIPIDNGAAVPFEHIYQQLHAYCQEQAVHQVATPGQRLRIRYEDLDGDLISLFNDQDWQVMLGEWAPRRQQHGLKVDLYCDFFLLPGSMLGSPARGPAEAVPPMKKTGDGDKQDGEDRGDSPIAPGHPKTLRTCGKHHSPPRGRKEAHVSPTARQPTAMGPSLNHTAPLRKGSRTRAHSASATSSRTRPASVAESRAAQRSYLARQPTTAKLTAENLTRSQTACTFDKESSEVGPYATSAVLPDVPTDSVVRLDMEGTKSWEFGQFALELRTMASVCSQPSVSLCKRAVRPEALVTMDMQRPPLQPRPQSAPRGRRCTPHNSRTSPEVEQEDAAQHRDVLSMLNEMREENKRAMRRGSVTRKAWH